MARDGTLAALMAPDHGRLSRASGLSVLAGLLGPVQAAAAAWALAGLLRGEVLWLAPVAFAVSGVLRALLSWRADGLAFEAALCTVTRVRARIVSVEAQRLEGPGAGLIAALAGEKLEALMPYITRYALASDLYDLLHGLVV